MAVSAYLFPASSYTVDVGTGGPYTLGVEFEVSQTAWLRAVGAYRPTTAVNPSAARVWRVGSDGTTGTAVAGTDVTFATSGTGWQTAYLSTPVRLEAGVRYRAGVLFPTSFPTTASYWTSGAGANGVRMNYLYAPPRPSAVGQRQGTYTAGSALAFPATSNTSGPNYWVDVILTDTDPNAAQPGPDQPIFGIDVSRYQAGLSMPQVKADGMRYVVARIGQGAGTGTAQDGSTVTHGKVTDSSWAAHRDGARAAGLPLAGYWYVGDGIAETAAEQAARCAALIGDPHIPVALDWETCGGDFPNLLDTIDAFTAAGLRVKMLYAPKWYYDAQGGGGTFPTSLLLWDSRYPSTASGTPAKLYEAVAANRSAYWRTYGGQAARMLQYASTATVAGQTVDADAFWGTDAELTALFSTATATETGGSGGAAPPGSDVAPSGSYPVSGVPYAGRPGEAFTPFARTTYSLAVFWIRTGEVIGYLPEGCAWDAEENLVWSALGAMSVTCPLPGFNLAGEALRGLLRTITREGSSVGVCLIREADRRALWAGPVMGVDVNDSFKITAATVGKLLDSRILIANPRWGAPNDSAGDLSFPLLPRDLVLELFAQGSTGYRRDLPLVIPGQSGRTGEVTAYKAEELVTVYEAVKKVTERDDGPEVVVTPIIVDETDERSRVRFVIEVGSPLLGSAADYRRDMPVPTWDWQAGLVDLAYSFDYSEMVSTGYVPGDSIAAGADRRRIIGVHVIDRGGDYLPALERADRQNTSSTNVTELNAQAREYVGVHAWPTHDWTVTVALDRWPLLGSQWRLGDVVRMRLDRHPTIPDGEYLRRVVGYKINNGARTLGLTTTDGSEIGLPRWRGV